MKLVKKIKKVILSVIVAIISFPNKIFAREVATVYGIDVPNEPTTESIDFSKIWEVLKILIIPIILLIGLIIYYKKSSKKWKMVVITIVFIIILLLIGSTIFAIKC